MEKLIKMIIEIAKRVYNGVSHIIKVIVFGFDYNLDTTNTNETIIDDASSVSLNSDLDFEETSVVYL